MRLIFAAVLAIILGDAASAQTTSRTFDGHTVYKSAQCEVGRFARSIAKLKIDPSRLTAHVSWDGGDTRVYDGSASFGFPNLGKLFSTPNVAGELKRTIKDTDKGEAYLNIHPDNAEACQIKNRVPVQVFLCLSNSLDELQGQRQIPGFPTLPQAYSSCTRETTGFGKLTASGKVSIWVFSVGPSAEYNVTKTFNVTIEAPIKPPKG